MMKLSNFPEITGRGRNRWWCLAAGVLVLGVLLLCGTGFFPGRPDGEPAVLPVVVNGSGSLPFTAKEVIHLLTRATGRPPAHTGGDTTVFASAPDTPPAGYYRISVVTRGQAVTVVFSTGSKSGLHWAHEFFEAPFFSHRETRLLYALYSRATPHARAQTPRFAADLSFASWEDLFVLTVRFTPKLQPRTILR